MYVFRLINIVLRINSSSETPYYYMDFWSFTIPLFISVVLLHYKESEKILNKLPKIRLVIPCDEEREQRD